MSYDYSEIILVQEAAGNLLRDCMLPKLISRETEV